MCTFLSKAHWARIRFALSGRVGWFACLFLLGYAAQAQTTWTTRSSASNTTWTSLTYGKRLFVAVAATGSDNRVMTSANGTTWTSRTPSNDYDWQSITYGNGLFVAVASTGTGGRVMTSPDGITWASRSAAVNVAWQSVTYGEGLFVAVASSGTIGQQVMSSPDGITWTSRSAAVNNTWTSVTYGGGVFVAVSNDGTGTRVMSSENGITWTSRTSAANNTWTSVTYGDDLFVAVASSGTGNRVMSSPDGITWTIRTSAANVAWQSVTYGGGFFVAVANSGTVAQQVMTSEDAVTWTSQTSAANNDWNAVIYGNGLYVAVAQTGTGNRVMSSGALCALPGVSITASPGLDITEGQTTTLSIAAGANSYQWQVDDGTGFKDIVSAAPYSGITTAALMITRTTVEMNGYKYRVLAGNSCSEVVTSDASVLTVKAQTTWTGQTQASVNMWQSVAYGAGVFVAVAATGSGNRVMSSPDGVTWTSRSSAADMAWVSVTYGLGLFVAVGTGDVIMTSPDGITWTSRSAPASDTWTSVTYGGGLFVAVGSLSVMSSADGITWTSRTGAANSAWTSVTYGGGLFVAVAGSGSGKRVMSSPDGINWTGQNAASDNTWLSVTYGGGLFVSVASNGSNRIMTSPDGITWTGLNAADAGAWASITYGAGIFVTVTGSGTGKRVMSSLDGVTWVSQNAATDNAWSAVTYGNGLFVAVASSGTDKLVMTSGAFCPLPAVGITATPRLSLFQGQNTTLNAIVGAETYQWQVDKGSGFNDIGNTAPYSGATSATLIITDATTTLNAYKYRYIAANACEGSVISAAVVLTVTGVLSPWVNRTSAADINWQSVIYGEGLFVAVANNGGLIMTSPDGITWTSRGVSSLNSWKSVGYGGGVFVAIGFNISKTSPDGITWTVVTDESYVDWTSVSYGGGLFVAVGGNGKVKSSPDGTTWTTRSAPGVRSWQSVTYAGGLFVAVSTGGTGNGVMTSPDGITWTSRVATADNQWTSVTYGAGLFVAVAYTGSAGVDRVMSSPDGITWTSRAAPTEGNPGWVSVVYGNGFFVAVASTTGNNQIMKSLDGITWSSHVTAAKNSWQSVAYGNGLFVAVASTGTGNRVMTLDALCTTPLTIVPASNGLNLMEGQSTSLGASVWGSSYQWQVDKGAGFANTGNVAPYSNSTTATLSITAATASIDGYKYRLTITNDCGSSVVSDVVVLVVNGVLAMTTQPSSGKICAASIWSFTAAAAYARSYQWAVNKSDGEGFVNISSGAPYSGESTPTLVITGTTVGMNNYQYRVTATDRVGTTVTSNAAVLTVHTLGQWVGATDTNWNRTDNWGCATKPTATMDVVIGTATYMPLIGVGNGICRNLTINAGSTVTISGQLDIKGSITNNGTFTVTGSALFSGDAQTIPSGNYASLFVRGTGTKTLGGNVKIAAELSFSGSYLQLGDHDLLVDDNASITGHSKVAFVITNGTGKLKKSGIGAGGESGVVTFPVGTSSASYTPVLLKNTGTADVFTVGVLDGLSSSYDANHDPSGTALTKFNVNKTWQVSEGVAGGSIATLSFEWRVADEQPDFTRANCATSHYYDDKWNSLASTLVGSGDPYSISISNVTRFSPFGIGSTGSVLPLKLLTFTSVPNAENVALSWETAHEVNTARFDIEVALMRFILARLVVWMP